MGYKMPIVCKDVIIPLDSNDNDITLDGYKEKYGIDLREFFEFDANSDTITFSLNRKNTIKLYVYFVNYSYPASPLELINDYTNSRTLIALGEKTLNQEADIPNAITYSSLIGFYWDHTTQTLKYYEL